MSSEKREEAGFPLSNAAARLDPDYEQVVTDILVALDDWLTLPDGPTVDDARLAVMRELCAYFGGNACPLCGPDDDCDPERHLEAEWRAGTGSRDPQGPPIGWRPRSRRDEP